MTQTLLQPKKDYFAPMHTAEHILNQTMVRKFGCSRSISNHIEKNKSKCDYLLSVSPSSEELQKVEEEVNKIIAQELPVTAEEMSREEALRRVSLERLSEDVPVVRLVFVGDYDVCPCIGKHVENTREIGIFKIISWTYENGRLRIRYKLEEK